MSDFPNTGIKNLTFLSFSSFLTSFSFSFDLSVPDLGLSLPSLSRSLLEDLELSFFLKSNERYYHSKLHGSAKVLCTNNGENDVVNLSKFAKTHLKPGDT